MYYDLDYIEQIHLQFCIRTRPKLNLPTKLVYKICRQNVDILVENVIIQNLIDEFLRVET